jgi:selenocysteine-specific elongation factor
VIIALAGHVDHGKTALIQALTGIDADRLPEEKRRGMTIDLGFAHRRLPSGAMVGFVDVPGHERFLSNMLAGVLSIDTVLLVVAADDGPMPQTREHLSVLGLTGVTRLAAVITKIDRVDADRLDAARAEVRAALHRAGYETAPMLEVSSVTGDGIPAVLAHIEAERAAGDARDASGRFRLAIDRVFSPAGAGLVVTGTVAAGTVSVGDRLMVSPSRLAARVRGIQVHHEAAETARAGDRCALAISGPRLERARLKRGDWLIDPDLHAPTRRLDLLIRATIDRGPKHAARVHVHLGAADITGRLLLREATDLAPGEGDFATVTLDRAGAALWGDRVILRDASTGRVVAGGQVIDPFPPEHRRKRAQRDASLAAHAIPDPGGSFRALLAAEGWADLAGFILARNLPPAFLPDLPDGIRRIGSEAAPVIVSPETIDRITEGLVRALRGAHEAHPDRMGLGTAELVRAAALVPAPIVVAVMDRARDQATIVRDGLVWRLPDHRPSLSPLDEAAWPAIATALEAAGLRAPRVRELATEMALAPEAMEAMLVRLERFGRLARVAPNRFFLPETLAAFATIARDLADGEAGGFTAAEFNKRTGIGRNLTIELLEFMDRTGLTRRTGDLRHVVTDVK